MIGLAHIFLKSRICYLESIYTVVVINLSSSGEASIFTATCLLPAKSSHSHMFAATSFCFSVSERPNAFSRAASDDVDCFKSSCKAALDTIGFPYGLAIKSSTSCVIVVTHRPYFLALLTS